jgi:hypothetical protein
MFAPGRPPILPNVTVYFEAGAVAAGTSIADLGAQRKQQLSQDQPQFALISEGAKTLDDGTAAYEIVYTFLVTEYNVTIQDKAVYVIRGTDLFSITGVDMPGSFAASEPKLNEAIYSFHLQ